MSSSVPIDLCDAESDDESSYAKINNLHSRRVSLEGPRSASKKLKNEDGSGTAIRNGRCEPNHDDWLTLNVRGTRLLAKRETLVSVEGSAMAHMFEANSKFFQRDGDGAILMDCDAQALQWILDILRRGGEVTSLPAQNDLVNRVRTTAQFFGLDLRIVLGADTRRDLETKKGCESAERRTLMKEVANAEARASKAKARASTAEERASKAENERDALVKELAAAKARADAAEMRASEAEDEHDELKNERQYHLLDEGAEIWQNIWCQTTPGISKVLSFPNAMSVKCASFESESGACMPGVHSIGSIKTGRTTQTILVKGTGYTLAGLVSTKEEKEHLSRSAIEDFTKLPFMTLVSHVGHGNDAKSFITLNVDMIYRRAELYVSKSETEQHLEPKMIWTELPEAVWIAVAFKRTTGREAVLMPCAHWAIAEIPKSG